MDIEKPPPLKETATQFMRAVSLFASSEAGSEAKWMFVGLLALLCGANGLNVINIMSAEISCRRSRNGRPPNSSVRRCSTSQSLSPRLWSQSSPASSRSDSDSCGERA